MKSFSLQLHWRGLLVGKSMTHKSLYTFAVFVLALVMSSGCMPTSTRGQQKAPKDTTKHTADIDALVASASSSAPEFSADLLIRIAESNLFRDKEKKAALLEDAFRRSSEAQQKVRRKIWAGPVDSRSGYLSAAYDLRLDELSLKSRVVKAMLGLDAPRARALFSEIPKLKLSALSCPDALGYEVSEFYTTLQAIGEKGFDKEEKAQGEGLRFVSTYLDDLTSPAQVGPAANLIVDLKVQPSELSLLVGGLSARLKKIQMDPKSYALSMRYGTVFRGFQRLVDECKNKNVPADELLSSFRSYMIRQLSSVQCADSLVKPNQQDKSEDGIAYVNKWFASPIQEDDIRPSQVEPGPNITQFWSTAESLRLLMAVKALRFGNKRTPLSVEERNTPEWQENFVRLLSDLENWDGSSEKIESDYFHEKSELYRALFDLPSSDDNYVRILLNFASFLRNTDIQKRSRIEWLLHANYLLEKMTRIDSQRRSDMLDTFKNSGNSSLQLYASFHDLLAENSALGN